MREVTAKDFKEIHCGNSHEWLAERSSSKKSVKWFEKDFPCFLCWDWENLVKNTKYVSLPVDDFVVNRKELMLGIKVFLTHKFPWIRTNYRQTYRTEEVKFC